MQIETTLLHKITGVDSINATGERFGIHGTDLGILWDAGPDADGRDRVFVMFGDTYGEGWGGHGAGPKQAHWRTNTLLSSSSTDLEQGMHLERFLARASRPGATQAIRRNRLNVPKVPFPEHTLIPNSGVTVDGVHYVHWMSILLWQPAGRWRTFQAGIAVSRDDARTWQKPITGRWPNPFGSNRFQIGSFAIDPADDAHVYLFGTTNGRWGPAYLARTPKDRVAQVPSYRYFDGRDWVRRSGRAAPLLGGNVGELSVEYHAGLGRWLAVHLDESQAAILVRTAPEITGPWDDGHVLASGVDHPGLYGGFLHPWALEGDSIYWLMSQWDPYNVFLMRSTITAAE
ncbi:hypothetical protein CGZ93_08815 [Enemella dayhoffiae]|uniref:DUF4185 domain-containing protein n=1 Tax=Enemella dayhoffiae TaxID=2016507 RepID=A0A255H2X0_9ACTN|nr:DUF4185 domain-containing protein [Enemella dayhoffiae]OYO22015.1 hypothetical protein CGZ93_08815 [Enemella dayhoffiae]